ncbi:MAG: type II toxin-antitoxin system VapC family toxin [Acidimicrobiales bacterium]|nr:type II toxin-antitoxin system VapC family toxin [Acidimicrobiales bacterium]
MTLTDAGPLIALISTDEADQIAYLQALSNLSLPLETTWPAFAEAMCILRRVSGCIAQRALWRLISTNRIVLVELSTSALATSARLMDQYGDRPMDLANATLVAYAEENGHREIFTLDSDFLMYRIRGRQRFVVIPKMY